jgi:hypothetical protein
MQAILILLMVGAIFLFAICWALIFLGIPIENAGIDRGLLFGAGIASAIVMAASTSLLLIGQALLPRWERGYWRVPRYEWRPPRQRRASVPIGRLVSLGSGIAAAASTLGFSAAAIYPEDQVPKPMVWAIVAAFVTGFLLTLLGIQLDQRRLDWVREMEDAQQLADTHL